MTAFTTAAKPIRRAARSRSVARRGCRMLAMNSRHPYVIVPWPPNGLRLSGARSGAERGFTNPILHPEGDGTFPAAREGGTAFPVRVALLVVDARVAGVPDLDPSAGQDR